MKYNPKNLYLILILLLQIVTLVLVCLLLFENKVRNTPEYKMLGLQKADYDKFLEALDNKMSSETVEYEIVDFNDLKLKYE